MLHKNSKEFSLVLLSFQLSQSKKDDPSSTLIQTQFVSDEPFPSRFEYTICLLLWYNLQVHYSIRAAGR